jgi:hypothetical protein
MCVLQNKIITSIHYNQFIYETEVSWCAIYIHCNLFILIYIHYNLFIHLYTLQSIYSSTYITIYSIKKGFLVNWPQCADNRGYHACVVEQRRQRRPARAASTAMEETDMSDVDNDKGDRRSRERHSRVRESGGDLESFRMKNETTRNMLIFICSKISETVLNQNYCCW